MKKHKNEVLYNPFKDEVNKESDYNKENLFPFKDPKDYNEAATISFGNRYRLKKLIEKGQRGDDIHLVTLGGSITEGSGQSDGEYYGDNLYNYLKERFPKSNVKYTNMGRGTTTTIFGSGRIKRDIEPLNPDIIIVEYAVNNLILEDHIEKETFEGTLHQLLNLDDDLFVFVMFTCLSDLKSSMDNDIPICDYYKLPMSSFKHGILHEISKLSEVPEGYIKEKYVYDDVHPSTFGYKMNSDFVIFQIEKAIKEFDEIKDQKLVLPIKPLTKDRFFRGEILNRETAKILENNNFNDYDKESPYIVRGLEINGQKGDITFEFDCRVLSVTTFKSLSPRQGKVKVFIDGKESSEIDGYFHNGWGGYNAFQIIIDEDIKKKRKVKFVFDMEKDSLALEKAKELDIPEDEVSSKFLILDFIAY